MVIKVSQVPVQFYIDKRLHKSLKEVAKKKKRSQSEVLREYISRGLAEDILPSEDPLSDIVGIGESGIGDLSEKHDIFLSKGK